jgi:hypothetical protein
VGLRADPHAWSEMYPLVASTPTTPSPDEARRICVAALRRVIGIDIDATTEPPICIERSNHGGMGGGHIDLSWWRAKGIPLVIDRAILRRPAPSAPVPRPPRSGGVLGGILV